MSKKITYFFIFLFILLFGSFSMEAEADILELLPPVAQQKEYPLSAEGFKELLLDLSHLGTEEHYTIQFDGLLDLSQTTVGINEKRTKPTFETINFSCVSANFSFKGIGTEAQLFLPNDCFFGQDSHFNSLSLQAAKIYGNGHQLFFEDIGHTQTTRVFGGSNCDLAGNPKIIFQRVIGGSWEIFGGNEAGILTGSPTTQVLDLTGDVTQLCGGSLKGKILGDVTTEIRRLNGMLTNYFGGGLGAEGDPVEITGRINNQLISSSADFSLGNFVGGAAFGKTGPINTLLSGAGGFTESGVLIGGSQTGEIYGQESAITTRIDTRQFQKGERSFVVGNQYSGAIYGDIENQIYAGKAFQGSFKRIDGAGGMDVEKKSLTNSQTLVPSINLTDPQERTAEELTYDQLGPTERYSLAKSQTNFLVEGNVRTRLMGGCVSRGLGSGYTVCGAGYAGVINGKVSLSLGEESLVYSMLWEDYIKQKEKDPNFSREEEDLGSTYGFSGAAGGGDNQSSWENALYIKGETELIVKQALLSYAYGGSFNGVVEGNSRLRMEGGQASGGCGAGSSCYRVYGDSLFEMIDGKIERYAVAGSTQDRRMIGDARAEISGGKILGVLAASYGSRSNHMIDGNVETIVSGGTFQKNNEATQIMGGLAKNGMISGNVSLKLTGAVELAAGIGISAVRPRNTERTNQIGGVDKVINFELATEKTFSEIEVLGDGAENPNLLYTPAISMKINTPNGSFSLIQGMVKNSFGGSLTHELAIDIQAARSIKTIIGSDLTTFNNRLIEKSEAAIALKLGSSSEEIRVERIYNFTQLAVENKVEAKSILNGSGATSENFEQEYQQFGELSLKEGAKLLVEELKTGKLFADKNAEVHSPAGAQNIFLEKLVPEEKLIWRLLLPKNQEEIKGKYFVQQSGYPVMTFAGKESSLSPENFIGFDEAGRAFTGDSNGEFGLAVAATIIDYQVTSQLGEVAHSFFLKPDNHPLPLDVWGITDEREGEIIIPARNKSKSELKFSETDQVSFQQAEVLASNGEKTILTENFWQPTDNYFYQIKAAFQQGAGSLKLLSVPTLMDFGQQAIGRKTTFYPEILGKLEIKDTRKEQNPWELTLQAEGPEEGMLYFQANGKITSLDEAAILFKQTGSLETTLDDWDESKGIFLKIPKERQKLGNHPMTFHWTLTTKVE